MKHLDAKRLRPGCSDAESVNPRETPIYNFSPGMNKLPVNGPLSGYDEVSEDSSSDEDKTLEDILRRAQKAKRRAAARLGENHEPRAPRKVSQKELARIKHESHRDNVVVNQLGQDVGKINLETGSGEKPGLHQP